MLRQTTLLALRRTQIVPAALYHENVSISSSFVSDYGDFWKISNEIDFRFLSTTRTPEMWDRWIKRTKMLALVSLERLLAEM